MTSLPPPPSSILIIGTGVFGLSLAHSLSLSPRYTNTQITLLDRTPFPFPYSSSCDTSRIVRADYASAFYSALATRALTVWRGHAPSHPLHGIGADGRYSQTGLVLTDDGPTTSSYVTASYANVAGPGVTWLPDAPAVAAAVAAPGFGARGYVNTSSGWADAEAALRFVRAALPSRVTFAVGEATRLVPGGVELADGTTLHADVVVVAAGAWSLSLLPELRGRAQPTAHPLGYYKMPDAVKEETARRPVVFNTTRGVVVIPQADGVLKVTLHTRGRPEDVPVVGIDAPAGEVAVMKRVVTAMAAGVAGVAGVEGEWRGSRTCWYMDTPTGDFVVDWVPGRRGVFVATGGSGHAFKFLPVLGEVVRGVFEGKDGGGEAGEVVREARELWRWRDVVEGEGGKTMMGDGSRGDAGLGTGEEAKREGEGETVKAKAKL
ncbi:putative fructosyl amino acid oxidasesarcosine oxidase [Geopyxis carbonaria]|nr:putative fructosyl amino acid oxidasesarcosine oxidase [Geopyxis carbonaria]